MKHLLPNEDMKTLKRLLSRIYQWVDDHKMVVNPDKTKHIRFGKLPMEEEEYNTPDRTKIKKVQKVKDLEVTFQEDGSFKSHIADVKAKAINMASWLLRTFRNRSLGFMRFLYRTYLIPLTDYCSNLYSQANLSMHAFSCPPAKHLINIVESVQRRFTSRISNSIGSMQV